MEKEFNPYELALALKELGFDEPCFANWIERDIRDGGGIVLEMWSDEDTEYTPMSMLLAPLYQQAFRWFREKYKLSGEPQSHQFYFSYNIIYDTLGENTCKAVSYNFKSYEEAELECLKKLIEIVKEK